MTFVKFSTFFFIEIHKLSWYTETVSFSGLTAKKSKNPGLRPLTIAPCYIIFSTVTSWQYTHT